jgi:hypothetical protein
VIIFRFVAFFCGQTRLHAAAANATYLGLPALRRPCAQVDRCPLWCSSSAVSGFAHRRDRHDVCAGMAEYGRNVKTAHREMAIVLVRSCWIVVIALFLES